MTTKVFCDGCDKNITELGTDARHDLKLTANSRTDKDFILAEFSAGPFDLCGACVHRFKRECDPKQWARCARREQS